ncbi:MAG: T9SS type A sorting domain-containing protein, partial [Candidatus Aegiribacteria sp.]|nr:T9SS type A sorting domain-containing protein [Candidatus Aegiribacteria sp.]
AIFSIHLPVLDTVSLTIYEISGRAVEEVYHGPLEAGDTQWSFSAPAGMYTAMLRCEDKVESLKFVIRQ